MRCAEGRQRRQDDLPEMRHFDAADDADRRVRVLPRMRRMRRKAQAQARRLLRVLQLWQRSLPADAEAETVLRLSDELFGVIRGRART